MSETTITAQAETADVAQAEEAPKWDAELAATRVWFRRDYSRAIVMVRTSRQARYGAPWDAKATEGAQDKIDALAQAMADAFLADNPYFDAEKFLAATKLPEAPVLPEGATEGDDDDLDADAGPAGPDELSELLASEE
jgi:hypothetical protein